jgi:murein L,D-transpeptidase YcbB/YkuD
MQHVGRTALGRARGAGLVLVVGAACGAVGAAPATGLDAAVREALAPGSAIARGVPEPVRGAAAEAWLARDGVPRYVEPVAPHRATALARETVEVLDAAPRRGLDPQAYGARAWREALDAPRDMAGAARLEAGLALAFGRHLADAGFGRVDPRALGHDLPGRRRADALAVAVRDALALPTAAVALEAVEPALPVYRALKAALPAWRARAAEPAPVPLPHLPGPLEPGDAWPGVGALRARLVAEGDLSADAPPSPSPPGRYDAATAGAVRGFQARHGLEADGVVGPATLAALRVPASARVRQIELTLERLRWIGAVPRGRWIAVNIPEYRLWALEDDRVAFSMEVVVGRAVSGTPVFVDAVEAVELNPYWNVPRSIASKEFYPRLARDPGWLESARMELIGAADLRGEALREALARGTARLRQRPGADNALGHLKLAMPNAHDVYLHDTPARAAFGRSRRDFSHGCIRLQRPVELAAFVLAGRPEGAPEALRAAIGAGERRVLRVAPPVQVMILYATVNVGEDGRLRFVPDVYGHDARLDAALRALARRDAVPADAGPPAARGAAVSPGAHAPGVEVHEALGRIEPDTAGPQLAGRVAQRRERHVGEAQVDRAPLEMQARAGDAPAAGASQHLVGPRRAKARDDLERRTRAGEPRQAVQLVEQRRVDRMDVAGAHVAHQPVDPAQRDRIGLAAGPPAERQRLAGARVDERQDVRAKRRGGRPARRQQRGDRERGGTREHQAAGRRHRARAGSRRAGRRRLSGPTSRAARASRPRGRRCPLRRRRVRRAAGGSTP